MTDRMVKCGVCGKAILQPYAEYVAEQGLYYCARCYDDLIDPPDWQEESAE